MTLAPRRGSCRCTHGRTSHRATAATVAGWRDRQDRRRRGLKVATPASRDATPADPCQVPGCGCRRFAEQLA